MPRQRSHRLADLAQSEIRAMTRACHAAGGINLGQGVCDLPTPTLVREGALPYFRFPLASLAVARDELMYERVARVARAGGHGGFGGEDLGRKHLPCTAGRLSAVVFEDGTVAPCEILGESIGNLRDVGWDLGELWRSARARELRERIRDTRCQCTWECAQADNILFHARNWPRLAGKGLSR